MSDSVRKARLRPWLLAFAASLLLLGASPRADAAPITTVAVGDSITNGARPAIMKRFADEGWSGGVNAVGGLKINALRPYLQYIAGGTPSLQRVYFFGGTNDALERGAKRNEETEAQFKAQVDLGSPSQRRHP